MALHLDPQSHSNTATSRECLQGMSLTKPISRALPMSQLWRKALSIGHFTLFLTLYSCLQLLSQISQSVSQFSGSVRLFVTPWIAARQASLSITNSWSSLRLTSIESVKPSSHLILCHPLLLLPLIPPSIRVFSNESTLRMRWPKYWSFSLSISPSKEIPNRSGGCLLLSIVRLL